MKKKKPAKPPKPKEATVYQLNPIVREHKRTNLFVVAGVLADILPDVINDYTIAGVHDTERKNALALLTYCRVLESRVHKTLVEESAEFEFAQLENTMRRFADRISRLMRQVAAASMLEVETTLEAEAAIMERLLEVMGEVNSIGSLDRGLIPENMTINVSDIILQIVERGQQQRRERQHHEKFIANL